MSAFAKNEQAEQKHREAGSYYDVLYDFTKTMFMVNDKAADGENVKILQRQCKKVFPAFVTLCGMDMTEQQKEQPKPKQEPEPKPKPRTVLQVTLKTRDDWGLCPVCGTKCIKVRESTILVNFPMFCKRCKSERLVTWQYKKSGTSSDTSRN